MTTRATAAEQIPMVLVVVIALVAAFWDFRTGRIPNWLTLPSIVLGLLTQGIHSGPRGLLLGLLGVIACGIIPYVLFRVSRGQGIGGGDIKLFAAIGAFLGPMRGVEVELLSFLTIVVFALAKLAYQGALLRVLLNTVALAIGPFLPSDRRRTIRIEAMQSMRMGPAILASVVSVLVTTLLPG